MSWKDILKIGDRWNRGGKHRSHDESNNVNYDEYGQRMDNWKHRDHQSPEGKTDPNSRYTTQPHKEEMDKVWDEVVNNLKQIYGDKIQMVSPKWNQSTNMWYKNLDILTQPNATPLYVKFTLLTMGQIKMEMPQLKKLLGLQQYGYKLLLMQRKLMKY